MTVKNLCDSLSLKVLAGENAMNREINGCYIGDLLSWVMGKAKEGNIWLTVMGNINAIGVASMLDLSCIILTDNAWLDDEAKQKANKHSVCVLSTDKSSYELAILIERLLI